jgi:c-di-GMP-binding flagellar brake protein YcgR
MTLEPSNQVFDDLNSPEFRQYAITERVEVIALLERMAATRTKASIYFNAPPGSMMSMVFAVDAQAGTFLFDCDSDPRRTEAAIASPALGWRSSLDGITLEFTTARAHRLLHGGQPALMAQIPETILRLQRRNAFRAEVPLAPPLYIMLDESGAGAQEKQAQVIDISALGMCLLVDVRVLPLVGGMRILRARLDLPDFGAVLCGLEVRYILSAGSRHPEYMRRCGTRFVDLGTSEELLIARYINALERERARSKGTALGALSSE